MILANVRSAMSITIQAVVGAAEAIGVSRARMLAALGMRWEDLNAIGVRVSYAATAALWAVIEEDTGDPLVGIRIARAADASGQAPLFRHTIRSSATVAEAGQRIVPMLGLIFGDGYELVWRREHGLWELGYHLPIHGEPPIARSEEAIVVGFVEQCRAAAPSFAPTEVCFQHGAIGSLADWRREVGCTVTFDAPFYGVRVGERALNAEIPGRDPHLADLLEMLVRPLVAPPASPPGPADPAIRVIRDLVDRGEAVSVDVVARALHVSRRTLQRQLAAARTSVRAELARARKDAALALLRQGRTTVAEIATRIGFADASQLTRAVRRWTGAAPTQLRGSR